MLGNSPFYHKTLRKITTIFGTVFNDIFIVRTNTANAEVERIKVPISYGPKEKYVARLAQDPTLNKAVSVQVPRMSFYITSFKYDGDRKRNKIRQHTKTENPDELRKMFDGVPYNLSFELAIFTKNQDDANQIIEQIMPFFTPDWTPTYLAIPELNLVEDLPIVMTGMNLTDNYDDEWKTRRNIIFTLTFDVKAYFYGPIRKQGVIKHTQVDIHAVKGDGPVTDEEIATTPRHVRLAGEIDPPTATREDPFGFIETIEEFDDGKIYDPVTDTDVDI